MRRITEPTTLLTDYVLGAWAAALGLRLLAAAEASGQISRALLGVALCGSAAAAFLGGTYHGFAAAIPAATNQVLWKGTLTAVGVAAAFTVSAGGVAFAASAVRAAVVALAIAQLVAFVAWIARHDDFRYAVHDYASALILLAALALPSAAGGSAAAWWLLSGVAISIVAGSLQQRGLALHRWFNHNDLFHVIQMLALWLLYKGGMLLRDR
jgi:hypothetical protein